MTWNPGIYRIDTADTAGLTASEADAAARAYDGAISVPDLAHAMQVTPERARSIAQRMVTAGHWMPLGVSSTGARCYGPSRGGDES